MKSVLISIQPKWCELIASGKKTVEVRKTRPKLETPFKVYIYCTLPPKSEFFWHHNEEGRRTIGEYASELLKLPNGQIVYDYGMRLACEDGEYTQDNFLCKKVIGEFVCDCMTGLKADNMVQAYYNNTKNTCLTDEEIKRYANGKKLYYWHISDLVIYDKPKELGEFYRYCGDNPKCDGCEAHYYSNTECGLEDYCCSIVDGCKPIKRPPQGWCYVERKEDENAD